MAFHFSTTAADGARIQVPAIGLELLVCVEPAASDRAMTVIETRNAPGFGPPLHRHAETEIFHVLEGRYLFEVQGERFEARAGATITVPGGLAHGFVNLDARPSRQLVTVVPGLDARAFFIELGAAMTPAGPDAARLQAFSRKWGVDFLGPPLRCP